MQLTLSLKALALFARVEKDGQSLLTATVISLSPKNHTVLIEAEDAMTLSVSYTGDERPTPGTVLEFTEDGTVQNLTAPTQAPKSTTHTTSCDERHKLQPW